jgi:hypothetical protein
MTAIFGPMTRFFCAILGPLMSPLTVLYSIAIFLGSFLLFLIEPMAAKRLVPLLGGSAAVWTTCLVFFQVALLVGYVCAHWLATRLRQGTQALIYTSLLVVCLGQAAYNLRPELHASTFHPVVSVFLVLSTLIGLPFVVLSATNPLLQAWYARGAVRPAAVMTESGAAMSTTPPYRLFALSNFGSLLALVVYPWLVEPRLSLHAQSVVWLVAFAVFVAACSGIAWMKRSSEAAPSIAASGEVSPVDEPSPSPSDRALWLLLPAGGSLMLCAVTNHLTMNIAAIPLLWIVPLTMYLLSFVIAFSRGDWMPGLFRRKIPVVGVSVVRMGLLGLTWVALLSMGYVLPDSHTDFTSLKLLIPFYCLALLVICLFCHAELHRLRPAPRHVTSFYLLIAAGGALGSIFVGLVAPTIFRGSYELGSGLVLIALLAVAVTWKNGIGWRVWWPANAIALVVLTLMQARQDQHQAIAELRNFYGTLRVTEAMEPPYTGFTRTLYHGTIQHGIQIFTDKLRTTPTSYYAEDSGVGLALTLCCGERPRRVGVIGLGTGTLAAYGRKGDVFRFYDINPLVEPIARHLFTYLKDSAATIEIVPGDARLSLAQEPPQRYDVLVIDAFSSDAIPVHLITSDAIELYKRHLAPGGIIAVHVSNHFLVLPPLVELLAEHAGMKTVFVSNLNDDDLGEYSSDWVLMTNNQQFLSDKDVREGAERIQMRPGVRLWTDDYSSVLPLLRWTEPKEPKESKDDNPE